MAIHIVGVGGTGHKIIRAITHLAACGAFGKEILKIISIDSDNANGALKTTDDVISSYKKFRSALSGCEQLDLADIQIYGTSVNTPVINTGTTLQKTFNLTAFNTDPLNHLINFLFEQNELTEVLDQGFYGHTSIGTLIMNGKIGDDDKWKSFVGDINSGDIVFVAGSIFGGTGASCIPVVLEQLKKRKTDADFRLATLICMPYFMPVGDLNDLGSLQPNGKSFPAKARASLYYYRAQKQYDMTDALYIIGEPRENFSKEISSRGDTGQQNKAHPIELFAATSLIDFIKHDSRHEIVSAHRDSIDGAACYTWNMINKVDVNLSKNMQSLLKAAVFYNKFLIKEIRTINGNNRDTLGIWGKYYNGLDGTDALNNPIRENINDYFAKFINWIVDLHKRNEDVIDSATGKLRYSIDSRVKLFNTGLKNLFDNKVQSNINLEYFERLVYSDEHPVFSSTIYDELNAKRPKSRGGNASFPDLLSSILNALETKDKRALKEYRKNMPEDRKESENTDFLARENNINLGTAVEDGRLWSNGSQSLLKNSADALPNVSTADLTANDLSVPSPWSIFIMFELALINKEFIGINKKAFNQWCGLIALIALRKVNLYGESDNGIKIEAVEASENRSAPYGAFCKTLQGTLKPKNKIFPQDNEQTLYRVKLMGETIAFLSNNSIVCPSFKFSNAVKTKLNQLASTIVGINGEFNPPEMYFNSTNLRDRQTRYALDKFLEILENKLTELTASQNDIAAELIKKVKLFRESLGNIEAFDSVIIQQPRIIDSVYSLFEYVTLQNTSEIEEYFALQNTKKDANGKTKKIMIVDSRIADVDAASARASTMFVTENLLFNSIDATFQSRNYGDVYVVRASELLSDTMVVIARKGTKPSFKAAENASARAIEKYDVIWPISNKLLEYYTPEQINNLISIEQNQSSFIVSLKLPLPPPLNEHYVRKTYEIKKQPNPLDNKNACFIYNYDDLPLWAVWPYRMIKDSSEGENLWKIYNFFCAEHQLGSISEVLRTEPYFSGGNTSMDETRLSLISNDLTAYYYRKYKQLPQALRIYSIDSRRIEQEYGYVFLQKPEVSIKSSIKWSVGLDFGTTTTTAFYKMNNDKEITNFLRLNKEYYWDGREQKFNDLENDVEVLSRNENFNTQYHSFFIDTDNFNQQGFSTAYEVLHNGSAKDFEIFDTGRMFWHNLDNINDTNTSKRGRNLYTNLKWGQDEENKSYTNKFLSQLLTHIVHRAATENVKEISWYFSYPTSFGVEDTGRFKDTLIEIIKWLNSNSGISMSLVNDKDEIPPEIFISESVAVARYFKRINKNLKTFVCVDIGGGSSDISIWEDNKHIFQTSVKLASRDLFLTPLRKLLQEDSVYNQVRGEGGVDPLYTRLALGEEIEQSIDRASFIVESALFEFPSNIIYRLNNLEGAKNNQLFKNFKQMVLVGYVGVIFYISNILITLLNSNRLSREEVEFSFGLSGKGSRLTDWIKDFNKFIFNEASSYINSKTKTKEYSEPVTLEFKLIYDSKNAKTETAKGLLPSNDNVEKNLELVNPMVFFGEKAIIEYNGEVTEYNSDTFINNDSELLKNTNKIKVRVDNELESMSEFIKFYNSIVDKADSVYVIPENWFNSIKTGLKNKTNVSISNVLNEKRLDAPFITALKIFLDTLSAHLEG